MNDRLVCVLGMHRSGTSLLAGVLNDIGIELGDDLIDPKPDNPDGFYEHRQIVSINKELQQGLERKWASPQGLLPFPNEWLEQPFVEALLDRAAQVLRENVGSFERLWGFKDPHVSRLLPFWMRALERAELKPLWVLCLRHPAAVAESIYKRDGIPRSRGELLWLEQMLEILRSVRGPISAVVQYERWFQSPEEQVGEIGRALGLDQEADWQQRKVAALQRIDPSLRHSPAHLQLQNNFVAEVYDWFAGGMNDLTKCDDFLRRYRAAWEILRPLGETLEHSETMRQQEKSRHTDAARKIRYARRLDQIRPKRSHAKCRHYDGLPSSFPDAAASGHPLRICIATADIEGPVKNSETGAAYGYLSERLVREGHDVTILYVRGEHSAEGRIEEWVAHYGQKGIRLLPMPEPAVSGAKRAPMGLAAKWAYGFFEWLKHENFDLVHVPNSQGIGYFALLAKRLGLRFHNTVFAVKATPPAMWEHTREGQPMHRLQWLMSSYIERMSVELADVVISNSQYMLHWMESHGYSLPRRRCYVQPNLTASLAAHGNRSASAQSGIRQIVFYGRLDPRDGLKIFCDAIGKLAALRARQVEESDAGEPEIVFLGQQVKEFDAASFIEQTAANWPFEWRLLDDMSGCESLSYLSAGGRLAVISPLVDDAPSRLHHCLMHRVPVIASRAGGIPELIREADHEAVLVEPQAGALATRLLHVLEQGIPVARPAFDLDVNMSSWLEWHRRLTDPKLRAKLGKTDWHTPLKDREREPLVSVCLVHHERPDLLPIALESLEKQSYRNFEVIVVDDGSTSPEAVAFLDDLDSSFDGQSRKLIRQENRYVGAARNNAVRHSRGKYILFMDDDNYAKRDEIARFVEVAERVDADVLTCFRTTFSGTDRPQGVSESDHVITPLGADPASGLFRCVFGDSNCFFKRQSLEQLGGFTEHYKVGKEDMELFARAVLANYRLFVVPESLFRYRLSEVRMRHGQYSQFAGAVRVYEAYADAAPEVFRELLLFARSLFEDNERLGWRVRNLGRELNAIRRWREAQRQLAIAMLESRSWRYSVPIRLIAGTVRRARPLRIEDVQAMNRPEKAVDAIRRSLSWRLTVVPRSLMQRRRRQDDLSAEPGAVESS